MGNTGKGERVLFGLRSEVVSHWALVAPKGWRDPSNLLMELFCRRSVLRNCPCRVNAGMEGTFRDARNAVNHVVWWELGQSVHAFQRLSVTCSHQHFQQSQYLSRI
jgi:hypothetical protein